MPERVFEESGSPGGEPLFCFLFDLLAVVFLSFLMQRFPSFAPVWSLRWARGCAAEALPAADTAEAEQGQPSKFSSEPRSAQKIWQTATRRREGRFSCALPPYREPFISFPFYSLRWARGGGRGFRFPLPTPSGLPTHPNDQGLNPGPKRGSRSVQRPKKHSHACPWKLQRSPNGGTGVFLDGLCPLLRLLYAPAVRGRRASVHALEGPGNPKAHAAKIG